MSHFGCWIWTWRQDPGLGSRVWLSLSLGPSFLSLWNEVGWMISRVPPVCLSWGPMVHVWIFCLILEHLEYVLLLCFGVLCLHICVTWGVIASLFLANSISFQLPLVFFVQRLFYLASFSLMFLHWILSGLLSPRSSLTQELFVTWVSADWPKVCSEGHLCSFRMSSPREIADPWK